jgi:hypothetical protein
MLRTVYMLLQTGGIHHFVPNTTRIANIYAYAFNMLRGYYLCLSWTHIPDWMMPLADKCHFMCFLLRECFNMISTEFMILMNVLTWRVKESSITQLSNIETKQHVWKPCFSYTERRILSYCHYTLILMYTQKPILKFSQSGKGFQMWQAEQCTPRHMSIY